MTPDCRLRVITRLESWFDLVRVALVKWLRRAILQGLLLRQIRARASNIRGL